MRKFLTIKHKQTNMKKLTRFIAPVALLMFLFMGSTVWADFPPPPPMPGEGHGSLNDQPAGPIGGPIDGGLSIMLVLGAMYGGQKLYKTVKEEK
jgi:hypothetical protein